MRSWIRVVGLLLCALGWPLSAGAQSIALSSPASTYQAPATFGLTIAVTNGTGTNKYRIDTSTIVFLRNNQSVHFGTTTYTETNLPVGTYSYKATATAFNPDTLHEYTVQSNTITITVTAPPAPTGTVTATPNPCNIAMGSTTCATTISWNSTSASASVWVTDLNNNGAQQFASGQNGAQAATWITAAGSRFHLKVGSQTLSTVDVLGNPPPPPSGTISGSPNPCAIAPGNTSCNITVNWSSVNAPTADVWVSDLNNNGMVPFASTPNGSQATVMPASTAKRMHLKFGSLTLATVDIQAGALPPPSGTITASPGTCSIAPGSATCPATVTWNTYNATAKVSVWVTDLNGNEEEPFSAGPVGAKSVPISTPGMRFRLKHGSQLLATVDVHGNPAPLQPSVPYRASKTETIEYHNDPSKWVMGQVKRSLVNGIEVSRTVFDTASVLPLQSYSFGKLQQTLSYYADGNLATFKDGNNNVTTLSNWYRGLPRTIQYPATVEAPSGATQTAVVNDKGWITSVTDENGYKTCYGYDAMGRVSLITYPSETAAGVCDNSAWTPTTITFTAAGNAAAYGMPAGHWRQTVLTGNGRKVLVFDAFWRPVVEQTMDLGNVTGTLSEIIKRYDAQGRLVFQSYPMNTNGQANYADTTLKGVWTEYDALDRTTSVSQDSELGLLTTLTEYLTGFKTRVTPPKGVAGQTTTSYMVYDQPSHDWPTAITHPEGAFTDITRDVFGKPTALTRRNSTSSLAITRSYTYNANQELCRSVEPETGATLSGYDAAGNLKWSAAGLPAGTACEANGTGAAAARRVDRTYDARNRVKALSFPDTKGNQAWTYTPDGLVAQIDTTNPNVSNSIVNTYNYNKRRLLTSETVNIEGSPFTQSYAYNANGHLLTQTYANTTAVSYAPNALGQPTQVGTYATGASYYPNGALKQFTYGNGIVHTMTQNARQLPSRSTDCTLAGSCAAANQRLDLGYAFDKHANVSAITDYTTGARQTRGMTYDNLDRLTQTTSAMFGTASYGYDVLDNLARVTVGASAQVAARDHFYCYDTASRQLTFIRTGSCSGAAVTTLGYDVQGNVDYKNNADYVFDFGNRLRSAPGEWYAYDGHGRRVLSCTPTACDYQQYASNGQLSFHQDNRKGLHYVNFYLGGSLVAIREQPTAGGGAVVKYQHTDALGTPIATTDSAGAFIEKSEYEPYGQLVNRPLTDGPGFTGHVQDAATGLTYMQQRYYDPGIGRFLSIDPITANSGTGANFNRYWYSNNNPYRFIDPDGRQAKESICEKNPQRCKAVIQVNGSSDGTASKNVAGSGSGTPSIGGGFLSAFSGRNWITGTGSITDFEALADDVFPAFLSSPAGSGFKLAGAGIYAIRLGEAAPHIVLGLRAFGLEQTAARVGGSTLLNNPAWRQALANAIANPAARFTVSVEGMAGTTVYAKVMAAITRPGASATNWEMAQLAQAGRLGEVTFVNGAGRALANPF